MTIRLETPADASAVNALYDQAFGPGQYAKAASLLRQGNSPLADACMVMEADGALIGACRIWPLRSDGGDCVLLGPIAIDHSNRHEGMGGALASACLEACDRLGIGVAVLVGDMGFFGRFGFTVVPAGRLTLPAPADPKRLLWRVQPSAVLPTGRLRA
jgi:predicted N-acetyltransferase YhbS